MDAPDFPKADPATPAFWDLRYAAAFTPWEAGRVPSRLRDFIAAEPPAGPVLVPGCGTGHDVLAFARAGTAVEGIDFSDRAIEAAKTVLGLHADRLRQDDFFAFAPRAAYALVYERAFLCALPRGRWADWSRRVAALLAPGGQLAGYFFFGADRHGPPFALRDRQELEDLLGTAFACEEDAPSPDAVGVFAGRERWMRWRRLQSSASSTDRG